MKLAARWIEEINLAERDCERWWKSGDIINRRYRNDDRSGNGVTTGLDIKRRYAILWSNVQTLGPAIYAKSPTPNVSRRFKDEDPVGKVAADVLERAVTYTVDFQPFDERMIQVRTDYLLPGRGQVWVRYVPTMEQINPEQDPELDEGEPDADQDDDPQEPIEKVAYEEVLLDHVEWKDFLTNPCRSWAEVRWVARRVYMTKDQLEKRFPGKNIPLDSKPQGSDQFARTDGDKDDIKSKACIYEIWDKTSRKAFWISKGYEQPCDVRDDPLKLSTFFPCPVSLNATMSPGTILPVPDYVLYQDQAEELDDLTGRIGKLQDALRMVGMYAGENNVLLQNVFQPSNENRLIPVDSWAAFQDKGGIKGIIEWVPVDMVMQTLKGCYEARQQVINDIYQITGLSDILRGESDPNATATAERIKGQWGSLRVRDRQRDMQRFSRDIIRLFGEIIAEHFSVETLKAMTGVHLLTQQEKQQISMQMQAFQQQQMQMQQQAQAMGQQPPQMQPPVPQDQLDLMEQPSWDEVTALLKDDKLRSFRIDIETDSTIEPDENAAKQALVEYVGAFSQLMTVASQIVPAAPYTAPIFKEMALESARVFSVSRSMEDAIEKAFDTAAQQPPAQPPGPPPPDPNLVEAEKIKAQTEITKAQSEQQRTAAETELGFAQLEVDKLDLAVKADALARDPTPQGSA